MSADVYVTQINYTSYCLGKNVEGVTHDESLVQPQDAGNCLNWVVGHLVATRNQWLRALGEEEVLDREVEERYQRASEPMTDEREATKFGDLLGAWEAAQARLQASMLGMPPERLDELAPFSPGKDPDETWRSLLAGLCFHEAYHVGQTGVLRRLLGKSGVLT